MELRTLIFLGVLFVGLLSAWLGRTSQKLGKIVPTTSGDVRGTVELSREGREFYQWRGIPYAKAPVGELRFASPEPPEKWEGVRDAYEFGSKCAHLEVLSYRIIGEEDCLTLNVHVPKLPVMVWIHGGGFNVGASNEYLPDYFMDEDVVLVVFNYRLGVFGFLSTGDGSIRGNMGLKDQVQALKWVKDNIENFGGDSSRITIFGESAGGASVHYMLVSPRTKGLFHKAIAQSGVATNPWAFNTLDDTKTMTNKLAQDLKCNKASTDELAKCLRGKSKEDILRAATDDIKALFVTKPHQEGKIFVPTVEAIKDSEAFLTEHPLKIVADGRASRVPWMTGVTADEGLLSSVEFYNDEASMETFEANWEESVLRTFQVIFPPSSAQAQVIAGKIREYYFPTSPMSQEEKLRAYTQMFSDAHFNLQMSEVVRLQREFSPTYLYHYGRRGGPSLAPLLAQIKTRFPIALELLIIMGKSFLKKTFLGIPPYDYGVCHGDELGMQFYMPYIFHVKANDEDNFGFSKEIIKFWVDFAADKADLEFRGVKLSPSKSGENPLRLLNFNATASVISAPFHDRLEFLKSQSVHLR